MEHAVNETLRFFESGNATEGWKMRVYPAFSFTAFCWLPISGSYNTLPRILFYCTIVFALVGWGHKWLIAGALGASLVYSGQAAIHACLLVWRGPSTGENDIFALAAILTTSAILTVPLLNWSKSLRELTLDKSDKDNKDEFSKVRSIIIYWGFLTVIGLFSILVLIVGVNYGNYFSGSYVVQDAQISCFIDTSPANYANLRFLDFPLNITTYFLNGTYINVPVIDAEWAELHGCSNPCQSVSKPAIFRSISDYRLTTLRAATNLLDIQGLQTKGEHLASNFEEFVIKMAALVLPYIILQGIWTATFGRRSPTQIRDALYMFLRDMKIPRESQYPVLSNLHPHRKTAAKLLALIAYFWALFVTIICMPVMLVTIVAAELWLYQVPQSESASHVGAWSPWAGTALVLIAALISQYQEPAVAVLRQVGKPSSWRDLGRSLLSSARNGFKNFKWPILTFFITMPASEWKAFWAFWRDADTAKYYNRHGKPLAARAGQYPIQGPRATTLPTIASIVPRRSWWNTRFQDDTQYGPINSIPLVPSVPSVPEADSVAKSPVVTDEQHKPTAETRIETLETQVGPTSP